jgi:hypothetical protein
LLLPKHYPRRNATCIDALSFNVVTENCCNAASRYQMLVWRWHGPLMICDEYGCSEHLATDMSKTHRLTQIVAGSPTPNSTCSGSLNLMTGHERRLVPMLSTACGREPCIANILRT